MIEVIKSGAFSSIQDLGRFGYRDQGVPLSGAMDQYASVHANQLLGNAPNAAVMEFALQGPSLLFRQSTLIAINGGDWKVELNNESIDLDQLHFIPANSTLKIKNAKQGLFGYLAVKGGFQTPEILGSRSYYLGITEKSKLTDGQLISILLEPDLQKAANSSIVFSKDYLKTKKVEVYPAPEFDQLSSSQREVLADGTFRISKNSDRMAFQLAHEFKLKAKEISTAPVEAGTVQLTPSGQLIVLMRDAQTTGGYARVLQLSAGAINHLAQKKPGEEVCFDIQASFC